MIKWRITDYGFHFTFSGIISVEETEEWVNEVKDSIAEIDEGFSVFADMRKAVIFPNECKALLENIQSYCRQNGMARSVVIISDDVTYKQMKLVAKKTGICKWERYINSETCPDWEKTGQNWLINGIDPDLEIVTTDTSQQASS